MSLISLVLAFVFPLAGIITALLAQREIKASNGTKGGANLAKSALLISVIVLLLEVVLVSVWAVSYFQALNAYNTELENLTDELNNIEIPEDEICYDLFGYEEPC